jgi:predicted aspartyl protease
MNTKEELLGANNLYRAGKFPEAEKAFQKIAAGDTGNYPAVLQLGGIALLANRLDEARQWLKKAIALNPEDPKPKRLLAEACIREDDFQSAAAYLREAGLDGKASRLEFFAGKKTYHIENQANSINLKFVATQPLPVIQARVNGAAPVNLLIDTGAAELILDPEFAAEAGASSFGSMQGVFAGGLRAGVQQGAIDTLTLGETVLHNIPVAMLGTRRLSPMLGNLRIDGIIGTVLFYHFLTTMDYPEGELILRRRTKENLEPFEKEAERNEQILIPFWMAGDHFMAAWGTINSSQPLLFLVDTGMAGGGFGCPVSTLEAANIQLEEDQATEGEGGGGKIKAIPFLVDELSLGEAKEHNIPGIFGAMPPDLESMHGFHLGGIISHEFFKYYALTFDFTSMRLFLKRKKEPTG